MEETDQVETDEAIAAKSDVLMAHATTYGKILMMILKK